MPGLSLLNQGRSCLLPNQPRHPWVLVSGEDCYAWDDQGQRYLDFASGATGNLLGHGHPRVVGVLGSHARGLLAAPARGFHRAQVELATELADLTFADRILFCRDAKEARAAAVALSAEHRRLRKEIRPEIIVPMPEEVEEPVSISVPGVQLRRVRYGDAAAVAEVISERTSGVMAAPLAFAGGILVPPPRYMRDLRALCDAARALLIVDESRIAIGRTGTLFASDPADIRPDMQILAHSLAAGDPFGIVLLREELSRGAGRSLVGFNLGGAPLQCGLTLETIRALVDDDLLDSCARVGRYLFNQLTALRRASPLMTAVSGAGLMLSARLAVRADDIVLACRKKGVLLGQAGHDTLLVVPPLTIQRAHVRALLATLREVFREYAGDATPSEAEDEAEDEDDVPSAVVE